MIDVCIVGAMGQMGQAIARAIAADDELRVTCGVDLSPASAAFPVYSSLSQLQEKPQVVIDFTRADNVENVLSYCVSTKTPALICSTAHTPAQRATIGEAAKTIPVYFSYNNSLGVALLKSLIKTSAAVLGPSYDIEILEKHHNRKVDAPSGTAVMLFNVLHEQNENLVPVYDRHALSHRREPNEVGMMSFRGGTFEGEHSVFFAGNYETLEIRHTVTSREVFSAGTLRAARFIVHQPAGLYDMNDVLGL